MWHIKTYVIDARNVKYRVKLGLGVVMTDWVVNPRVVIGVQISFSSRMGMLYIKTLLIVVRNVNLGVHFGSGVVMTTWVVITRVAIGGQISKSSCKGMLLHVKSKVNFLSGSGQTYLNTYENPSNDHPSGHDHSHTLINPEFDIPDHNYLCFDMQHAHTYWKKMI